MSQRAVEQALGKLLTDDDFRERFFENPEWATGGVGLDLSREQLAALRRVPKADLARLCRRIDDRICRLRVHVGPHAEEAAR
jgi:hypothetical protein